MPTEGLGLTTWFRGEDGEVYMPYLPLFPRNPRVYGLCYHCTFLKPGNAEAFWTAADSIPTILSSNENNLTAT